MYWEALSPALPAETTTGRPSAIAESIAARKIRLVAPAPELAAMQTTPGEPDGSARWRWTAA